MRWVGVLVVCVLASRAEAAWYYTYSCTGDCAQGELAKGYTSVGYSTQADCDAARAGDPNNISGSGNLGVLSYCRESDSPPSPDGTASHGLIPTQSVSLGVVAGPGYTWAGEQGVSGMLAGVDGVWLVGARPGFGLLLRSGLRYTRVKEGAMASDQPADQMWFIPLQGGFQLAFGNSHVRWELGLDIGWDIAAHCDKNCPTALLATVRTGLAIYSKHASADGEHRAGVVIEIVHEGRGDSDESGAIHAPSLQSPALMLRVSLRRRNDTLVW